MANNNHNRKERFLFIVFSNFSSRMFFCPLATFLFFDRKNKQASRFKGWSSKHDREVLFATVNCEITMSSKDTMARFSKLNDLFLL